MRINLLRFAPACLALAGGSSVLTASDDLVLRGDDAVVTISLAGGGITGFQYSGGVNPLSWVSQTGDDPAPRGHFLCLDRWGAPSAAEAKNGIPFHGEAPHVAWEVMQPPQRGAGGVVAQVACSLPLAGLQIERVVRLAREAAVLTVSERVTNVGPRGRIFNMVQHPTIAPPFLDASTVVDSNATQGFWQEGPVPEGRGEAAVWPRIQFGERDVDLRFLKPAAPDVTRHDVSSFVFDPAATYGWVTACNPDQALLVGYVWKLDEYPWLNIWRSVRSGKIVARGLEFGTTGYHQPFSQLVEKQTILEQPLYGFADAQQTVVKSYLAFLAKVPMKYAGVAELKLGDGKLTLLERGGGRSVQIELDRSPWQE